MRSILIPIDGTERSMKAVDLAKSLYTPESVNIVLLIVREDIGTLYSEAEPENGAYEKAARKAIKCNHMDDIVTLGGQLSLKPSSCHLPVQAGICVYQITVMEGRLRLNHLAFHPDGDMWNLPPKNRQPQHYDLKQGGDREIRLEICVDYNHRDKIEIVNPSMTAPLKFHYVVRFESSFD